MMFSSLSLDTCPYSSTFQHLGALDAAVHKTSRSRARDAGGGKNPGAYRQVEISVSRASGTSGAVPPRAVTPNFNWMIIAVVIIKRIKGRKDVRLSRSLGGDPSFGTSDCRVMCRSTSVRNALLCRSEGHTGEDFILLPTRLKGSTD
jgi:hypothetical protein